VAILLEVVWIVQALTLGIAPALSWRHHLIALAMSSFSVVDYFTTDVTNMRLRSLQMQTRPAGT
jgi:hypothetical protein